MSALRFGFPLSSSSFEKRFLRPWLVFASAVLVQTNHSMAGAASCPRLAATIDLLVSAGNYTWSERVEVESSSRPPQRFPKGVDGETVIQGYTEARIRGVRIVALGRQVAYELKHGWRHFKDLADGEMETLRLSMPGTENIRNSVLILPHEKLVTLLRAAVLERVVPGGMGAELDPGLLPDVNVELLMSGTVFPETAEGGRNRAPRRNGDKVVLTVWTDGSMIQRFAVEFWRPVIVMSGPQAGSSALRRRIAYVTELSRVGVTRVRVEPEVEVLFSVTK